MDDGKSFKEAFEPEPGGKLAHFQADQTERRLVALEARQGKRDLEQLRALDEASTVAPVSVGEAQAYYAKHSRNDLIRAIVELNRIVQKAELAAVVDSALSKRAALASVPKFLHREAFKLMRYVSEGGTRALMIWNSRDGVTPFVFYADGMKFQHDVEADMGPYMDRPAECDMQWETRTARQMMEAWGRSLTRAMLAGKIDQAKRDKLAEDVKAAQANHLHIGLRNLESGRFTDDF